MVGTEKEADGFVTKYGGGYGKAVEKLVKDRDGPVAFHHFPAERWKHIRTTNPIGSVFATVGDRTGGTRGRTGRKTALSMGCRLMMSAKRGWRKLPASDRLRRSYGVVSVQTA